MTWPGLSADISIMTLLKFYCTVTCETLTKKHWDIEALGNSGQLQADTMLRHKVIFVIYRTRCGQKRYIYSMLCAGFLFDEPLLRNVKKKMLKSAQ
jgi:hypothetical protein